MFEEENKTLQEIAKLLNYWKLFSLFACGEYCGLKREQTSIQKQSNRKIRNILKKVFFWQFVIIFKSVKKKQSRGAPKVNFRIQPEKSETNCDWDHSESSVYLYIRRRKWLILLSINIIKKYKIQKICIYYNTYKVQGLFDIFNLQRTSHLLFYTTKRANMACSTKTLKGFALTWDVIYAVSESTTRST